jgi:hypothetical protein
VHLQIKPGLRTTWRAPDAVQIGLDPQHGTLLEGLTPADRSLVEQLAGGLDEAALPRGPAARRARQVVALLSACDVLVTRRAGRAQLTQLGTASQRLAPDAAVWGVVHPGAGDGWELLAARARRRVLVTGAGRLATELAQTLTAAGVGTVELAPRAPATAQGAAGNVPPDLVVLVRAAAADSLAADGLLAAGVAHLAVVVREAGVVVGPLVLAGGGPCLRCLDLHRTDRDPGWPRLLAQLPGRAGPADAGETASARLGAGLAALQVLAHLDGRARPAAVGATLEIDLPDGLVARRPWPVHPACGCGAARVPGQTEDGRRRVPGGGPGPGQGE